MKHFSYALFIGLSSVALSQEPFTFETTERLFSTADLNGDGRLDAVVVDRATGSVDSGFQNAAGTYSWSGGMPTGATPVSCLTVGRLGAVDLFGVTSPMLGRLVFISNTSASGAPTVVDVFPTVPSQQSMAFFPLNSATAPELLVVGDRGTASSRYSYELRPPLTGGTTPIWQPSFALATSKIAAVKVKTGAMPRVLEYYGSTLYIEGVGPSGLLTSPGALGGAVTSADTRFALGTFDGSAYSQFFFYDAGSTQVRTAKITEPTAGTYGWSTLTNFTFPQAIKLIVPMGTASGGLRLGVIFADGTVSLYNYTGSGAPTFYRSLTPNGSLPADVLLPAGPDAALVARGGQWQRFLTGAADPTGPQNSGVLGLPGPGTQVSNVIYLTAEAFADTGSTVLGSGQLREWTTAATGGGTAWNITGVVSQGSTGLGGPLVATRTAPVGTTTTLVNQFRSNASIYLSDSTSGLTIGDVSISPPSGSYPPGAQPPGVGAPAVWELGSGSALPTTLLYDQPPAGGELIKVPAYLTVSLNPTRSGDAVWYRVNGAPWVRSAALGQLELYANAVIEAYSTNGASRSSIRRSSYTFTAPQALSTQPGTDTDADGLSDLWEKTFGATDPLADADGDGSNNLTEFQNGTDPRNNASFVTPLVLNATRAIGGAGTAVLRLEWSAAEVGVSLESSPNLQGPWTTISANITTEGQNRRYEASMTTPAPPKTFFRLRRN